VFTTVQQVVEAVMVVKYSHPEPMRVACQAEKTTKEGAVRKVRCIKKYNDVVNFFLSDTMYLTLSKRRILKNTFVA
jgi:hypothetical protein